MIFSRRGSKEWDLFIWDLFIIICRISAPPYVALLGWSETRFVWFMNSWQDDTLQWWGRQLNMQLLHFPRNLFLLFQPNTAQLRAWEQNNLVASTKIIPSADCPSGFMVNNTFYSGPIPLPLLPLVFCLPCSLTFLCLQFLIILVKLTNLMNSCQNESSEGASSKIK